jgi:hypothetical protein
MRWMAAGFDDDDDDDDDGCYSLDMDETGLLPLGAYSPYPCKPDTIASCAVGVGFPLYVSRYFKCLYPIRLCRCCGAMAYFECVKKLAREEAVYCHVCCNACEKMVH